jgi:glutamate:Na+ symporter, ESS family
MTTIEISGLLTFTVSIVVFFIGAGINHLLTPLRKLNIPEAVTGGMLAALVTLIIHEKFALGIVFDLDARDMLLLYFFTGIGLNAKFSDLVSGGRPLLVLLTLTLVYLVIQNIIAVGSAYGLHLPQGIPALLGSASLIGGHGTTIAWAPVIAARFGLANALEIGIAAATLGLVIASLVGGPIAQFLISRHTLSGPIDAPPMVGLPEDAVEDDLNHVSLLQAILVLNIAILGGFILHEAIEETGVKLPLFVACLLSAIALTNTAPRVFPRLPWPSRTRALALVSDLSLNVFLSMSLMSMQLWTLGGLGVSLIVVLAIQTIVAVVYMLFVVFPAMGGKYDAAVIAAGFGGIALGATPTAIANMTAVTKTHGASPTSFIILPLVSAFFIDLANAAAIGFLVR